MIPILAATASVLSSLSTPLVLPPPSYDFVGSVPWPASSVTAFQRAVRGEFHADAKDDAVVLADGKLVVLFNPVAFDGATTLATSGIVDMDVAPGVNVKTIGTKTLAADGIATVSANGLELWTTQPHPTIAGRFEWESDVLEGGDWEDATLVRSGRLDQNAEADYVAVMNGTKVLISYDDGTDADFTNAYPISDLMIVDWDGTGNAELAFITSAGIEIHALDGTLINLFPDRGPDIVSMTKLRRVTGVHERIACVRPSQTSVPQLYVLSVSAGPAPASEGPIDLDGVGNGDIAYVTAGNCDGDTGDLRDDLLVGCVGTYDVTLFRNGWSSGVPTFSLDDTTVVVISAGSVSPPSGLVSRPLLADMDRDDAAELFVPQVDSDEGPRVTVSIAHAKFVAQMTYDGDKPTIRNIVTHWSGNDPYEIASFHLTVEMEAPVASHVSIIVWRQLEYAPPAIMTVDPTESRSVYFRVEDAIEDGGTHLMRIAIDDLPTAASPANDNESPTEGAYWIEVRYAEVDPDFHGENVGGVIDTGPSTFYAVSEDSELMDVLEVNSPAIDAPWCPQTTSTSGPGTNRPAGVKRIRIPRFDPAYTMEVPPADLVETSSGACDANI